MSQQRRRVNQANAAGAGKATDDSTEALIKRGQVLLDGIGAAQSTDYLGDPDTQRAFNENHDRMWDELREIEKKLKARGVKPQWH